jgi:hypothetical protein
MIILHDTPFKKAIKKFKSKDNINPHSTVAYGKAKIPHPMLICIYMFIKIKSVNSLSDLTNKEP